MIGTGREITYYCILFFCRFSKKKSYEKIDMYFYTCFAFYDEVI